VDEPDDGAADATDGIDAVEQQGHADDGGEDRRGGNEPVPPSAGGQHASEADAEEGGEDEEVVEVGDDLHVRVDETNERHLEEERREADGREARSVELHAAGSLREIPPIPGPMECATLSPHNERSR
jgi:hypothetical protein